MVRISLKSFFQTIFLFVPLWRPLPIWPEYLHRLPCCMYVCSQCGYNRLVIIIIILILNIKFSDTFVSLLDACFVFYSNQLARMQLLVLAQSGHFFISVSLVQPLWKIVQNWKRSENPQKKVTWGETTQRFEFWSLLSQGISCKGSTTGVWVLWWHHVTKTPVWNTTRTGTKQLSLLWRSDVTYQMSWMWKWIQLWNSTTGTYIR